MSFKKEIVLSVLSFALANGAFAQPSIPHRSNGPQINSSDPPSWVSGQQYRAEVRQEAGPWGINLEMLSTLQLDSAQVSNVYVVAASQSNQETLRLNLNGRTLNSVTLNNHLQMIVFPVNRSLVRSFDKLELIAKGAVYISEIGLFATGSGNGDDNGNHHDNPFPGWPLPGYPVAPPDDSTPSPGNRQLMEFRGAYDQTDVSFEGHSRSEIEASCTDYLKSRSFSLVDEVKLFSDSVKLASYIQAPTFCAWAGLNARPIQKRGARYETDLSIGGLPFRFRLGNSQDSDQLRNDINLLAPKLQLSLTDEVERDGQTFKLPAYLNADGTKAVLLANLPLTGERLKADGSIEGFPFRFEAYAREDLRSQCATVLASVNLSLVDKLEINGQSVDADHYLDNQEICMAISADAN